MPNPEHYTVGWICAVETEHVAARAFLDEEHGQPDFLEPQDNNTYTLGRIGNHNVVIAVLPHWEYGLVNAATVARDLIRSFPSVRIGLMVGIGGGAPTKHDIRLGDIVVSSAGYENGGVFQYDYGKTIQDRAFTTTGFLNKPPTSIMTAVTHLSSTYQMKGHELEKNIENALEKYPRLRNKYQRPDESTDKLYKSHVVHPDDDHDGGCETTCGNDRSKLILRSPRTEHQDNPTIHRGLIASANQLMKDALIRDELAKDNDVLCFEMEAAGLMNHFPCLVIRGICDYSDTHKSMQWQGYAAMAAAAYAKDLLNTIPPNKVNAERRIGDIVPIMETQLGITREGLEIQKRAETQQLTEKQQKCLQLFRLTSNTNDATYEWYKGRVENRIEGTCVWLLEHADFQKWLDIESGVLLITADPGCGKSVLAKYLIDHVLPQSDTICYYFFKDQDQNTIRQALCAIFHQLFSQKPNLIEHAMKQYEKDGDGLINSTSSLWAVLRDAVQDPRAGSITIVLDALDECAEAEFDALVWDMCNNQLDSGKLKYLLTSRPYETTEAKFSGSLSKTSYVRIRGEDEFDNIGREVSLVIEHRVKQLAVEKDLPKCLVEYLIQKLLKIPHRTYLWVYLMFNYLEKQSFKKTQEGIDYIIGKLPKTINDAYEQILSKSQDEEDEVQRILSMILAATRPLTLSEMNIALNIKKEAKSFQDIDLENEEDFNMRLRSICGLFVSVHHKRIYFLHQTAREFLLKDAKIISPSLRWERSITSQQAHAVLMECCMLYLDLFNLNDTIPPAHEIEGFRRERDFPFLEYSGESWAEHFHQAGIRDDKGIMRIALKLCDTKLKGCCMACHILIRRSAYDLKEIFSWTSLTMASYLGLEQVVEQLLENSPICWDSVPLWYAAFRGHERVASQLIENGADVDQWKMRESTPLMVAAQNGHTGVVRLLLSKRANILGADVHGRQALHQAARRGHKDIVKLLLENGAQLEAESAGNADTPLMEAVSTGKELVVEMLLERKASIWVENAFGWTPFSLAAWHGHDRVVKLLYSWIPLHEERQRILEWLTPVDYGPLSYEAENGDEFRLGAELEKWMEGTGQMFHFWHGGYGATEVFTWYMVNELTTEFGNNEKIGIAYIYLDPSHTEQQSPTGIFESILKQLVQYHTSIPGSVISLYEKHQRGQTRLSHEEISSALISVACSHSKVFIFIASDSTLGHNMETVSLLSQLFDLQARCGANLFLITSLAELKYIRGYIEQIAGIRLEDCDRGETEIWKDNGTLTCQYSFYVIPPEGQGRMKRRKIV
ncbi:hypothetical protein F4821DRAFT_232825 [Hypoxylon rubiginosum]|uniref:Uncharacterized protein n=1 Tax=Hypoxylon rubiginosum TaxID=110542 RepID=A0ACC0D7H6_9PEZI|nr:hypothetical protein F4821DRAFT_232825 [Hypoxylon rubiginosum]